jgi:Trk-type K+ transport system membrane component
MNYAALPGAAKLLLALMMIVGRLELYTILVLLFLKRRV